jgi:hypothetical protein
MMQAIHSSDTSDATRSTRHNIPEDGILIVTTIKTSNLTQCLGLVKKGVLPSLKFFYFILFLISNQNVHSMNQCYESQWHDEVSSSGETSVP